MPLQPEDYYAWKAPRCNRQPHIFWCPPPCENTWNSCLARDCAAYIISQKSIAQPTINAQNLLNLAANFGFGDTQQTVATIGQPQSSTNDIMKSFQKLPRIALKSWNSHLKPITILSHHHRQQHMANCIHWYLISIYLIIPNSNPHVIDTHFQNP